MAAEDMLRAATAVDERGRTALADAMVRFANPSYGTCTMISGVHLHLLVNHAPLFGALFALALLAASFIWAPDVLRRTALVVLVGTAVASFVADQTGEPAEDAIRGFPGVKRDAPGRRPGQHRRLAIVEGDHERGAWVERSGTGQ